jgi:DNA-binding PadR family transcriptional regulator
MAPLLGKTSPELSPGQLTYDLRRLRLHGLIERRPRQHRYRVTDAGLRVALFISRLSARTLRPGLATVMPDTAATDSTLRRAFEHLEHVMDEWCAKVKVAA